MVNRHVGLRPGMRLDVGMVGAENLLGPVDRQLLRNVHMFAPAIIAFVGILNLYLATDAPGLGWLRRNPVESVAIAFFAGSLAFINTWDFPLIAGILGVVILARAYHFQKGDLARALGQAAAMFLPILALSVALFLPFYLGFGSQASGILPLADNPTRPFLFFLFRALVA